MCILFLPQVRIYNYFLCTWDFNLLCPNYQYFPKDKCEVLCLYVRIHSLKMQDNLNALPRTVGLKID